VIIEEGLYDRNFVSYYSHGFEEWRRKVVGAYAPARVAEITGLEADAIVGLARDFAKSRAGLALWGRGRGLAAGGAGEAMAVHALNAVTGRVNRPGGVWALPEIDYINWPPFETDAVAAAGMQQPRIDGAGGADYPDARSLPHRFFAAVAAGQTDAVEALLVFEGNPLYTEPDTATVKQALDNIPLVVSFASLMDETAAYADLVLPNHLYLERYEDLPAPAGLNQALIGLTRPVVEPQQNTRHAGDAVIALAGAVGGQVAEAFPWESFEACLQETLGDVWDSLTEEGYAVREIRPAHWSDAFATASGRFEFGGDYRPADPEGDPGGFPLVLLAYDAMRLAGGAVANTPFMTKTVGDHVIKGKDGFVEVNPKDAGGLGLGEGSRAELSTPRGRARVRVHLTQRVRPGTVAMPRGLGHTAYDRYLAGKGVNVNTLMGPVEDPASGLDAAWGIRAKLAKA